MKNKILILSLLINCVFAFFIAKRIYFKYSAPVETAAEQPHSLALARAELFESLPDMDNEIVLLGDSHFELFPAHELLKNPKVINRGIAGNKTKDVLNRLNEVTRRKPAKIILEIGVNDLANDISPDSVILNIAEIIRRIKSESHNTSITLLSVLPADVNARSSTPLIPLIEALNIKLKDLSEREKIIFADLYTKFALEKRLNPKYDSGDKVHLNGEGYILLSNELKTIISL